MPAAFYDEAADYDEAESFDGIVVEIGIYDENLPYDELATYDGIVSPIVGFFTPPTIADNPPFLPDTPRSPALLLFRHYTPRVRGINVFILSDSTVVQDTASPENSNTNVPYPWDPYYLPPPPFARVYDWHGVETDSFINPYITTVFYGGHEPYPVDEDTYTILFDAGYADCLEPV